MKFLLIDPSLNTLSTLSLGLRIRWPECGVVHAENGSKGIDMAETESPQVILMEIDLPDLDGFEVLRQIRLFCNVPIIVISHKTSEMDIVRALEMGADDYLTKPFSPLDLLARTRTILRRIGVYPADGEELSPFVSPYLTINFAAREVLVKDEPVHLTPTEYKLLCQLVRNAGRLVTLQALKARVWGDAEYLESGTIRKYMCQLRNKLEDDSNHSPMIINERGIGYKFVKPRRSDSTSQSEKPYHRSTADYEELVGFPK